MSRYTGPRAKISRRLGTNIFGTRGEAIALEKRPYPPGIHGRTRRRGNNNTEYLFQLQEKQKARFTYGLNERQFRRLYDEASRRHGVTGENMLRYLEMRLDNVVYRLGWGSTRPQARQFVNHGHVLVNGKRVDIPSYRVRKGDRIELKQKSRDNVVIQWNKDVLDRTPPPWLERGEDGFSATVYIEPLREHIDVPLREQLIVELYSK
jgi:small subunit ribosomal protein S4